MCTCRGRDVIGTKSASGLSFVQLQHSWLTVLNPCPIRTGCLKYNSKVEKSTLSFSYIIHQVAITSVDRTVYPRRPCVLPASAKVKVTLPPDWTLSALSVFLQPLNFYMYAACYRPWGLAKKGELRAERLDEYQVSCDWHERIDKSGKEETGVIESSRWVPIGWLWCSLLNFCNLSGLKLEALMI